MNGSQKLENLLNLSLEATPEEREKSRLLNVGVDRMYDNTTIEESVERWELIIRYHGDVEGIRALPNTMVEPLLGGYAIVWTTEDQISTLAALEQVEYVEKPKQLLYQVENGRAMSCVDQLQRGVDGLFGQGVLIAVLDSGIDWTLPEFRGVDGRSRIRYLWDQTLDREFTKEEIDEALRQRQGDSDLAESASQAENNLDVTNADTAGRGLPYNLIPSHDLSSHGTAVAGVAAGGSDRYRGMAPASELLIVKLGNSEPRSFPRTTQLMRGLDRVLRKALEIGRPVAVNISIGNTYGSHDGDSLLETFIDTAAGFSPNVIVIGSGNEGAGAGHYEGQLTQPVPGEDASQTIELSVGVYETGLSIQLWKSYVDQFTVELISPTGQVVPLTERQRPGRYRLGGAQVLVYYGEPKPFSQSQEILMDFLPEDTYLDSGVWKIRLTPRRILEGKYDLWLPGAAVLNRGTQFLRQSPDVTLTIPSTAARAITVGAYDARRQSYADFSGRGFLRNLDLVKPDLVAPGVDIRVLRPGGGTERQSGTSFAAPFVTGAAALLMEWGIVRGNDPYLYGEKVKAYLLRGARPLGAGGQPIPNERIGYGTLCVRGSIPG